MRHDAQLGNALVHRPLSTHVNYHPEKEARMASIIEFYHKANARALDRWNGGEGPMTSTCRGKVGVTTPTMPEPSAKDLAGSVLARNLLRHALTWAWAGRSPVTFEPGGAFASPMGRGTWTTVPSPWRKDSVHVALNGHSYLLMFLSEKWAFVAVRCDDEDVSYGRVLNAETPPGRLVF